MLVQRNPAALFPQKICTFSMEIMKEGAKSLRMKMRNAEFFLKEATVFYGFHLLAAGWPELAMASKLAKLDCSHLLNSEQRSKLSTD